MQDAVFSPESAVRERYAKGAMAVEPALCCAVEYDPHFLKAIPAEVIERDYGCGDPSKYLMPGETVLDLGSGTGKVCFIAAQIVGEKGRVIGLDMTDEMLQLSRKAAPQVAEKIGYANVSFHKARIQDLALDLDAFDRKLLETPIDNATAYFALDAVAEQLRQTKPLIADESIDVIVSNCVLNLVSKSAKKQLFSEMLRVLKNGGRAVISDIVSDEIIPIHLQNNPELWSGCISGAFTETGLLQAFEEAGFCGMQILEFSETPWQTVEGIEFRSVTIEAVKGKQGACFDRNQAVIYKGPFKEVLDDDGHRMVRGERYAMCAKSFSLFSRPAYRDHFIFVNPKEAISLADAPAWDYGRPALRDPKETKGARLETSAQKSNNCC